MARRLPWAVLTAVILILMAACQDPTGSSSPQANLHLDHFVITEGADQTASEGDTLPDLVVAQLKLNDGSNDYNHLVRVTVRSGNGTILSPLGGMASGDGGTLQFGYGRAGVRWILGPTSEPQVIRFWALGIDTVAIDAHATALPK